MINRVVLDKRSTAKILLYIWAALQSWGCTCCLESGPETSCSSPILPYHLHIPMSCIFAASIFSHSLNRYGNTYPFFSNIVRYDQLILWKYLSQFNPSWQPNLSWQHSHLLIPSLQDRRETQNSKSEKTCVLQMMHNAIGQISWPMPSQFSRSGLSHSLYADNDIIRYGVSLGSIGVSFPSHVPSQLLVYPSRKLKSQLGSSYPHPPGGVQCLHPWLAPGWGGISSCRVLPCVAVSFFHPWPLKLG